MCTSQVIEYIESEQTLYIESVQTTCLFRKHNFEFPSNAALVWYIGAFSMLTSYQNDSYFCNFFLNYCGSIVCAFFRYRPTSINIVYVFFFIANFFFAFFSVSDVNIWQPGNVSGSNQKQISPIEKILRVWIVKPIWNHRMPGRSLQTGGHQSLVKYAWSVKTMPSKLATLCIFNTTTPIVIYIFHCIHNMLTFLTTVMLIIDIVVNFGGFIFHFFAW